MNKLALIRRFVRSGTLVLLAAFAFAACSELTAPPAPDDETEAPPRHEDDEA